MSFNTTFTADSAPVPDTGDSTVNALLAKLEPRCRGLSAFFSSHAGTSYSGGLYRIHRTSDMRGWTQRVVHAFPASRNRIFCFGSDWLGRQFALDLARVEGGEYTVLMLEPGTGEALQIPVSLAEFHNQELVHHHDAALASEFYANRIKSGGRPPQLSECVGYRVPLFLGGSDTVNNLEISDMDVYWSLMAQMFSGRGH